MTPTTRGTWEAGERPRHKPHPLFRSRSSGVLLHPSSLPGPPHIGDIGPAAHAFIDWLAAAGQRWWQMLPIGPVGPGDSPYASPSASASEPLLLSLELLVEDGLLERSELDGRQASHITRSDYEAARHLKQPLLRRAFERWRARGGPARRAFRRFCEESRDWLEDHTLFCALREHLGGRGWTAWPAPLRDRDPQALLAIRAEIEEERLYHALVQYLFAQQWRRLRRHARRRGVALLGDLPIFVVHDSADVWAHRGLFRLDANGRPTVRTGVPPDLFSASGQLWGHPHYRWSQHAREGFRWWRARVAALLGRFHALRIDHFIGFVRAWEVPARARTARRGRWRNAPGRRLFRALVGEFGQLPLVAEDLGSLTRAVHDLREELALPGMRVLQFAFGARSEEGRYHQPHRHPPNAVVYTGTHDNDTTRGWFRTLPRATRKRVLRYCGGASREIHTSLLRAAWASSARTAIAPMQDLLGLGSSARMNTPGTASDNWQWRSRPGAASKALARELHDLTESFERMAP